MTAADDAFVLIPTHTPRYLAIVLAGLARQTHTPRAIVVSCDSDDPAIGDVLKQWGPRTGASVAWVRRPHMDGERLCQARNNGVRWLVDEFGAERGRLITLDGDMLASDTLIQQHLDLAQGKDFVYPYRVDVDEQTSGALDPERVLSGDQTVEADAHARSLLKKRAMRYRKQKRMRRLRLGPKHKPKLLGGHFSVTLELYLRLNGFDELYQGWGFKDDEFARRAVRAGADCRIAVEEILGFHLYHPTRQHGAMRDNPNAARFARRDLPITCEHGVRNPLPQAPVEAELICSA